ncbi:MAG: ABC transporter ATP-binding protein [Acidiferrobacteraceae bacterium]
MFIRKILSLFDARQRREAVVILFVMLVISALEAIGIGAIIPLMTALVEPAKIQQITWLHRLYLWAAPSSYNAFVVYLSLSLLALVLAKNLIIGLSYRRQYRFVFAIQNTLSNRLLSAYLGAPYQYFLGRNTAELLKNIQGEIPAFVSSVLIPALMLLSESVITVAVLGLLLVINAPLTLLIGTFLGLSLAAIFFLTRRRTDHFGKQRRDALSASFTLATKALSAVKDIKVLGREGVLAAEYHVANRRYSDAMAYQATIAAMPRLAIEVLAFIALISILMYTIVLHTAVVGALPLMALFAMAAIRLIPSFNRIFMSVLQLRYYTHTVNTIHNAFAEVGAVSGDTPLRGACPLVFADTIELRHITYTYPGAATAALKDVSLTISKGRAVGLVGPSGSGKTTLVDILLGLLEDHGGEIRIDGQVIDRANVGEWRSHVGYVPQQIYLADDTVAANIAFGIAPDRIDFDAVARAAEIASLSAFIDDLPEGLRTEIGERGVRLSGGQRQRIGIARALYHDPEVLIMDEATSALDGLTEYEITSDIERLSASKTLIVIAHRLTTVERCDVLYLLERGRITASGTYAQLVHSHPYFFKLAGRQQRTGA